MQRSRAGCALALLGLVASACANTGNPTVAATTGTGGALTIEATGADGEPEALAMVVTVDVAESAAADGAASTTESGGSETSQDSTTSSADGSTSTNLENEDGDSSTNSDEAADGGTTTEQSATTGATTQQSTTEKPTTTTTQPTTQPPTTGAPRPVAFVGVSSSMWDEINSQRSRFGDPNDCRAKVRAVSSNADVTVSSGDSGALARALASGAGVIQLSEGTYTISSTIKLRGGRQLVGEPGKNVVVNAEGVARAVELDGNSVLANLAIVNAENQGVVLNSSSLVYQVSVGRTGYGPTVNQNGAGLGVSRGGSNNCIVSAEAYEGFNEDGAGCSACENGGNADGVAMKFGASNNTVIDTHAYRNSDDGYDFWEGGTTYVYFGSAFDNGKPPGRASGDGNGLKLGRGQATHYLYKVKAHANEKAGFTLNGNSQPATLVQTEAYSNGYRDYVDVANS